MNFNVTVKVSISNKRGSVAKALKGYFYLGESDFNRIIINSLCFEIASDCFDLALSSR